ncbi:MAG: hypothetical protein JRF37_07825, partial [Deltaproteobacteria bacterium]|nr:hypothetical protein [Deltaproteobacteria bacterium]
SRQRFGDWEGDTVEGSKGTGGIASHVERKSRYLLAVKLTDKTANVMTTESVKAFRRVPKLMRVKLGVKSLQAWGQVYCKLGVKSTASLGSCKLGVKSTVDS